MGVKRIINRERIKANTARQGAIPHHRIKAGDISDMIPVRLDSKTLVYMPAGLTPNEIGQRLQRWQQATLEFKTTLKEQSVKAHREHGKR